MDEQMFSGLREALRATPDNVPLRRTLAEMLARYSRFEEAGREYREALRLAPTDPALLVGLARCFFEQNKNSEAMVIIEDLVRRPDAPAEANLLYARLLLRAGAPDRAGYQYRKAVEANPELRDAALEERLGGGAASAGKPSFTPPAGHEDMQDVESDDEDDDVQAVRMRAGGDEGGGHVEVEKPRATFDDVGGMDRVKEDVRIKIIHPLQHPELYKAYGKKIGGGILMYGPPGCGKTMLARATAGEVKAGFMSIGLHDVLDMWIGSSEKRLHEVFEVARRSRPCVLFFDEIDALAASRSDMRQSAGRQIINQFLAELDGVAADNDGVLILGATNAPWHLDSAFRRPGRFDRIVFVPPPDAAARAAILRILLKGKPVESIDHDHLAAKTDGFSGADLKAVVDVAVEAKLQEAIKRGVPGPLTTRDLAAALKQVKPSTKEWFATARNYALYSNEGGAYDDVLSYLRLK